MFYDNLKTLCDEKGVKITPLIKECGGSTGSISQWKKGALPNSEIVIKIAMRLNVSTDYLLMGNDPAATIAHATSDLSNEEKRLLDMFSLLTDIEKGEILGELKVITKERSERKSEETA